ncbi:MAG: neuraminidase-like domain-containing protein [Ferruginibacter sp.]
MHPITTPIKTDNKEAVNNLHTALLLLLSKQSLLLTADELNELQKQWKQEQQEASYGDATTKLVAVFQQQYKVDDQSGMVEEPTASKLNEVLKGLGVFDEMVKSFLVKGTITWNNGKPYSGATVQAFDHDLRSEKFLATATTNEEGFYEIIYILDQLININKKNANLQVKLMGEKNDVQVSSKIFYNASNKLEINLTVEGPKEKEISEWEIIDSQLSSLLKDQKDNLHPEDLIEKDINFLSESTGIEPGRIGMWSQAYKNAKDKEGIVPMVFYAWQRMNMPTDAGQLLKQPVNDLLEVLENAVAKNIIPAIKDDGIKTIQSVIETIQTDAVLKPAEEGQPTNLGSILFAASTDGKDWISKEKQQQLIGIHVELDPDAKDFATKIAHIDFTPAEQTKLQQTLRLDKLTQNNPALISGLQTFVAKDQDASLNSLASLQPDEWIDLAYEHGTPAGTFIETEVYAKQMEMAVEERLPTATLVNKINNGFLFQDQPGIAEIAKKLEANTVFDIATGDVKSIGLDQQKTALVQKLQNLKKLGASWDETETFINAGLTDVAKLADYSSDQIQNLVADGIAKERVKELHEKVKTAQAVGIGALSYYMPMMTAGNPIITGGILSLDLPAGTKEKINNDPTLRNLFGALEQCECDPCMSVLSPAAYYADLLNFIETSPKPSASGSDDKQNSGITLEERRPDLYDLELSCDNANIVLPHIDLVLEILENELVFPKDIVLKPGKTFLDLSGLGVSEGGREALQETAEDLLETSISVEEYTNDLVLVKDSYRRWIIHFQQQLLQSGYKNFTSTAFDLQPFDITEILSWLNGNADETTIKSPEQKNALAAFMQIVTGKITIPFSLASCKATTINENKNWSIYFSISTLVRITDNSKTLILESGDGLVTDNRKYDSKTISAIEKDLEAGKIPVILGGKEKSKEYKIEKTVDGNLIFQWYSIQIKYEVAAIKIKSLTYQSTAKDRDLLARAQNKNPLTYEELAKESSVYPWSLPYDQYLTELRILLSKAGIPRLDLINTNIPDDKKYKDVVWASEVLGISPIQKNIITTVKSDSELWTRWGLKLEEPNYTIYDTFSDKPVKLNRAVDLLAKASVVMQQASISFSDLQYLLSTQYINPGSMVKLQINSHCDPTNTILQNADIAPDFFDRFHRFVRLWKVTGVSISELDQAILEPAIGNGLISVENEVSQTIDTILHIAQLKVLQQKLNISFQTAIDFFTPFKNEPTISYKNSKRIETKSLYNKIFQNIHFQNPPNEDFGFNKFTPTGHSEQKQLPELLPYIAASLGSRFYDLGLLINPEASSEICFDLNTKEATTAYLHRIWRNVSLAGILQLSLSEYAAACRLISYSASIFSSPETLLNFGDEVAFVKKNGIGFEQLENILSGKNDSSRETVESADVNFTGLKAELEKCKDYFFREKLLTVEMLVTPAFVIPKTKELTWERWGLTYNVTTDKWSVEIGANTISEKDPMDILSIAPFLSILCNTSLGQINSALGSNFVTGGSALHLFEITDAATRDWKIVNLEPSHLNRLKLFFELGRVLGHDAWELDELLTSFFGKIIQPDKDALTLFIKANTGILQQRRQSVVTFLSKTYEMAEEAMLQLMKEKLTVSYKTESVSALELFIDNGIRQNPIDNNLSEPIKKVLIALQKISTLNIYWKADNTQLKWLRKSSAATGYLGIVPNDLQSATISYHDWKKSTLLFMLAQANAATEKIIIDYLNPVIDPKAIPLEYYTRTEILVKAFGLTKDEVDKAAISQGMNDATIITDIPVDSFQFDPLRLSRLLSYLSTLQKSQLSQSDFESLINKPSSIEAVRIARKLLYVRYGKDFAAALQEVNNKLRIEQRDRLVDYLCWRDGLRDANALYEKYLIDVEMQPCMKTTRLLQATAAAQLFVHRSLLNLEPNIAPGSFDKKRWEWTQNYRVWEANRRVFLYPENWLYPELRDDKTEIFKTFETHLTQNEASYQNVQEGLINYAEDLVELSKITVMGMHEYASTGGGIKLFQVGRTINPPYNFYSREFLLYSEWSGWEKIEQDLSVNHIVPFTYDKDLCIAWPEIVTQNENSKQSYEVGLSWIRKTNKGWTERKKSADKIKIDGLTNRDQKSMFLFRLNENSSDLNSVKIQLFAATIIQKPTPDLISRYLYPTISRNVPKDGNTGNTTITFYFTFYRRYTKTNRYQNERYGYIFFEKLLQHTKGQKTIDGENVVEYFTPGTTNNWSPAYSDNIFNFEVRNIGDSGHYFRIIFQGDKDGNVQNTVDPLIPIWIEKNKAYDIRWNVVIDTDVDDPVQQINSDDASSDLELKGEFLLFSEKDGEWEKEESANPLKLTPPENTFFYSSGLKESIFNTQTNQNYDVPINLLDNIDNDFVLTNKSKAKEKYFAVRSSNSYPMGFHTWSIEEGNNKMLVALADSSSSRNIATPVMVTLTAYSEAKSIKSNLSQDLNSLFDIQLSESFVTESFGLKGLQDYKDGAIAPLSAYADFSPFPFPFQPAMPYALYNWEVFYHLPIYAANFLSKQHKFEDARKWFHFIFDPTTNNSETGANRFWNFLPFRKNNEIERADRLLDILANPHTSKDKTHVQNQIAVWLTEPFNPFAVARMRTGAFEWFTVTSYIKNLIAWGDQLFRRDTRESINEATMLYVMASNILGRRKEKMGAKQNDAKPKSYRSLNSGIGLDDFANKWVLFSQIGLAQNNQADRTHVSGKDDISQLSSIGSTYFCVAPNDKIIQLWDDVDDRLFKIRNCQNIDGVVRNLPLLDPPIDPELLIRARAAGVSIPDALNDMYAPLPLYRFNVMQQKAMELCNEVKSLGSAILSAIEKKDAEHLGLLRSGQEIEMLKLVEWVKNEQIKEAAANIDSINKSRENIIARIMYLQRQMGNEFSVDASGIPVVEQGYTSAPLKKLDDLMENNFNGLGLIKSEEDQILWMQTNNVFNLIGGASQAASGALHSIAALFAPMKNTDPAGTHEVLTSLAQGASAVGSGFNTIASYYGMLEKRSGQMAGWQRRRDEWLYQAKTAVQEIKQLDKQIIASEIRKSIAEKELENHHKQIEHSSNLDEFVRKQKFSNETLYTWMESQLSNVYNTAYQMAYDQAKKAEKAFRFELGLGDEDTKFVQGDYWDSLKKGLLAGERLTQDLRRMEIAYLEKNKREFEITKHISLATLNANAILDLRREGTCNFQIPELLFEMDFPGHYFRRIKSVSISIPCIAGPYTSVSSQLSLSKSYIRKDDKNGGVIFNSSNESFKESYSSIKSIASSNAQGDSGMFELNFKDERYLPFEGAGVISDWELELPKEARQFDYNTISDVIITIRYTSRNSGSSLFKDAVNEKIKTHISDTISMVNNGEGFYRLLSLKNDFPDIFYAMKSGKADPDPKEITLSKMFFPYFTNSFNISFTNDNVSFFTKEGTPIVAGVVKSADGIITSIETIICTGVTHTNEDHVLTVNFKPSYVARIDTDDILILINYELSTQSITPVN